MTPKSRPKHHDRPFLAPGKEHEGLRVVARIIAKAVINDVQSRQGEERYGPAREAELQGPSSPSSHNPNTVSGGKMDEKFDLKRETDHWTSYLLASIAEGSFRDGVSRMIQHYRDKEARKAAAREEGPIADERLTLSIAEAAKILRISRNTAYSMASQGRLPVIRLGKKLLVPRKGLNELLSNGWVA